MFNQMYDNEEFRLHAWNRCKEAVWTFAPEKTWFLMGLANLDCGLIRKDRQIGPKIEGKLSGTPAINLPLEEIQNHQALSALWVFGAYEVVRSLHQNLREDAMTSVKKSELCFQMGEIKKRFERVRIPLAKFERPSRFPGDMGVAVPAVHFEKGAAWSVTPTEHVTRRELSDAFLEILLEWHALIQKEHAL